MMKHSAGVLVYKIENKQLKVLLCHLDKHNLSFLGSKKQSNNKLITVFDTVQDFDATKVISNTFLKEWPKGSGNIQEFPEMDRAEWFNIEEAKKKILKGQIYFLSKLEQKINSVCIIDRS